MKNDYITTQDVINEGEDIISQAMHHNLWLKRLYVGTTGWPVYAFRGTKEDIEAFLLDTYMMDPDDVPREIDRFKNAPAEYVDVHSRIPLVHRNEPSPRDTVTPTSTDDGRDG